MSQFRLDGKVAIITGGGSGIGLATAHAFLAAGASGITLVDISTTSLSTAGTTFSSTSLPKILFTTADTSSEPDVERYVAETMAKFGRLDISIQCAGIMQDRESVEDIDVEVFDRFMRVNVRGPFLGIKHSIKAMLSSPSAGKGCSIVVLSSQLGLDGGSGLSSYAATKFALRGLVLSAADDLGSRGIRVNAIAPGPIKTPMIAHTPAEMVPTIASRCMLGRWGEADEVADGILYLSSDAARYVTGTTLKVDGGYSRWA